MPQFAPGETKTARAPITVKPAGLSCQAELWLASSGVKVATSGLKSFSSTGSVQDITFPITMPSAQGTYPVYLDVFAAGVLIGAYQAIEEVVIIPALPIINLGQLQIGLTNITLPVAVQVDKLDGLVIKWQPPSIIPAEPGYTNYALWFNVAFLRQPYDITDPYRAGPIFFGESPLPLSGNMITEVTAVKQAGEYRIGLYYVAISWGWHWIPGHLWDRRGEYLVWNVVYCLGEGIVT